MGGAVGSSKTLLHAIQLHLSYPSLVVVFQQIVVHSFSLLLLLQQQSSREGY